MGIAMGFLYPPTFMIVGDHFRRRRALAMGIITCGSAFGGIVQPIILNQLFSSSLGFGNSIRCDAAINSVMLIIACLTIAPKRVRDAQDSGSVAAKIVEMARFLRERDYMLCLTG